MVEQQLRSLGLRVGAPMRPPEDDIRRPVGRPPAARSGWEQFLVAQKRVGDGWPDEAANRIKAARKCYEAGTHEMCSHTTKEGWTQLYCKPRAKPAGKRDYFTREGVV